ncbi:MAG: S-layer homology domain-containing protein [Clostridia bacterium]|nr:S-layer homology domain-containing protein [Clostridia bacterium]
MKRFLNKKTALFTLCTLVAAIAIGAAVLFLHQETAQSLTVSAGLQQFADQAYLACSAPVGQSVSFTPEWFDQTLQGGKVSAITVTALPPATQGQLKLGHASLSVGQVIPRQTLSYLHFVANEGVRESSFEFMPSTTDGSSGYTLCCQLSLTQSVNCCPTGSKTVTAVSTHSTVAIGGTLVAQDPEDEGVRYEILSYPEHGTLTLDRVSGVFSYMPSDGFVGEDRFTWRAQDLRGAFSEPAEVSVTVRELTNGYLYTDVDNGNIQSAAQRVSENALMSGEVMGGKHYFHPDRALSRAAFVAILMEAADIDFPETESTGFEDDAEIPRGMKSAIAYAKEKGWLGSETHFRPNDPITRAEAAKIAAAVLELDAPGYTETVEDFAAIPVDVADALYAIYEGGYLTTLADGTLAPAGALTRGDAARFFARILDGKDAESN